MPSAPSRKRATFDLRPATEWTSGHASRVRIERDWLGRRMDLRDCHRDFSCQTHNDPSMECTCRAWFRQWDRIVEWVLGGAFVSALLLFGWALTTLLRKS